MIRGILTIVLIYCGCLKVGAQFFDDFSDMDLSNGPTWEGDIQDFKVNDALQLQLDAADGDKSSLYTQLFLPDSIQWDLEILLNFSPSDNNRGRVYLAIDKLNIDEASGYYIEVGENGPNDALNIYFLNEGSSELIASGEMAALGAAPAFVKIIITRFSPGEWTVSTSYNEGDAVSEEFSFMHNEYDFLGNQILLLECNYTASRRSEFYFDNIGLKKYEPDVTGPEILGASLLDARTITIQANEKLDPASALNAQNYEITGYDGEIIGVELNGNETGVQVELSQDLASGTTHQLNVKGLGDVNGNVGQAAQFTLFLLETAEPGDLKVNEILFNPETDGSDFVEIVNVSEKYVFLGDLEVVNTGKAERKLIGGDSYMEPGAYLCLTENVAYLVDRYEPADSARLMTVDLPGFNNDVGNVSIINSISNELIDAYDYDENTHFSELDDVNGVSLERVSPVSDKWFSASSAVGFATPGYQNSAFLSPSLGGEEILSFESGTFSPNQDGMEDQLVIIYNLPDNGFQVDVEIYDQYGRKVRKLVNNELFAEQGFVLWDGIKDSGEKADIGIYIVLLEAFNVQGDVISTTKSVVLADFLK